jgi:tRNA pseudouridine38-40 synthase
MPRYFLEICFNGKRYHGWQSQTNAISVQQVVQHALQTLTGENVSTTGCCRTDTGVHALQFFVHVDLSNPISQPEKFVFSLNGILPEDIAVYDLYPVEKDAHARFDAIRRTYCYFACRHKNPFIKDRAAAFYFDLDVERIQECCSRLMSHEDFSAFARKGSDDNTRCQIYQAHWQMHEGLHCFTITANRFLRGMVRAITGTLVKAGKGLITPDDFENIIRQGNRQQAGASVPPHGLYLVAVEYPYLQILRPVCFPFSSGN